MKKLILGIIVTMACGCASNAKIANPNNVYRFAENTEVKVLVEDVKTGEWKQSEYTVMVPMGYYIGSGLGE